MLNNKQKQNSTLSESIQESYITLNNQIDHHSEYLPRGRVLRTIRASHITSFLSSTHLGWVTPQCTHKMETLLLYQLPALICYFLSDSMGRIHFCPCTEAEDLNVLEWRAGNMNASIQVWSWQGGPARNSALTISCPLLVFIQLNVLLPFFSLVLILCFLRQTPDKFCTFDLPRGGNIVSIWLQHRRIGSKMVRNRWIHTWRVNRE